MSRLISLLLLFTAAPGHALALRSVGTGRCVSARRHVDVSLKLSRTGKKAEEQTSEATKGTYAAMVGEAKKRKAELFDVNMEPQQQQRQQ